MEELNWQEHIRKRPGMYIGQINHKGFIDTLKKLITQFLNTSKSNLVCLTFKDQNEGEIIFKNIQNSIRNDIGIINQKDRSETIEFPILNALCEQLKIIFHSNQNSEQLFNYGNHNIPIINEPVTCNELQIKYSLDNKIWGDNFEWNSNYLSYELREFCYLNPTIKFQITEIKGKHSNTNSYQFINGLNDRLEIEILNAIGECYFKHHVKDSTEDYQLEAAFAFRQYSVDQNFIRTYVNNEITPENGSHLDGLLKGLTYGVMKYFQANNLVNDYKISEKGMKEGLVCMINIKMANPIFSGCVKNKLASSEVIEPIAEFISEQLYFSIINNDESTKRLIDKFKI